MPRKIVYYCPAIARPSGGVAVLLKQAMLLREAGYEVSIVYHPQVVGKAPDGTPQIELLRTAWLDFSVQGLPLLPLGHGVIHLPQGERLDMLPQLPLDADTLFVIPEGFGQLMQDTQAAPAKRLVFAQNWTYVLQTLPDAVSWRDYGIRHVLTVGQNIKHFIDTYMPGLEVGVVKYSINRAVFRPRHDKQPLITCQCRNDYMQAKLILIAKIFYLRNPHLRHYRFELLQDLSRMAFAEKLASSRVLLYTDEIAGMPTLPLEAMACHTIPVGWRTYGGAEFMHENNGFWVDNGDITGLAEKLSEVVNLHEQGVLDMARLTGGFEQTLHEFTQEQEQRNTLAYFQRLLAD